MDDKRKIIVIGSNSFSGSDLVDLLLEDDRNEVIGLSRSPEKSALFLPYKRHKSPAFRFHRMDLNKDLGLMFALFESEKPQYVVNFAAQSEVAPSWQNPQQWFQTNCVALAEFCSYLKDQPWLKRYVHISSPEVYGACEGVVKEDAPLNPSTPYAASKAAADLFLFTLVKNFQFPLVMIRSTNVYGAHQQLFKIIPRSVIYLKMGKPIQLHGGGVAVKSYIHIRDISRGELAAMENGSIGSIYHLSPDRGYAVRDVVRMICEKMGKDFAASAEIVGERLGQDAAYVIDSSMARAQLDWRPEIAIDEGLQGVVQWIDQNWDEIRAQPLEYLHRP
ncbi:MAG: NAD-dependent epimerase/dehydratase family protein [Deltaproteobacteria bacterium]|nr:NAD-dependent epimerase/dehydratase family protein [Deltaproteobacteria bacterium]